MASFLSISLQKLFFPGYKVPIKLEWRKNLQMNHPNRETHFISSRNGRISILYIASSKSKATKSIAILSHPLSRKGKFYFSDHPLIGLYLDLGHDVLLFDFNGFGESDRIDMNYWQDALSVIDWAKEVKQAQNLVLHGTSFGAFHIVRAAQHLPSGSRLILENVSRSLYDYWKRWPITGYATKLLRALPYQSFRDMEIRTLIESKLDHLHITFISCTQDSFTPHDEIIDLRSLRSSPSNLLIFECQHLEAIRKYPEDYKNQLAASIGDQ